MHLHHPLIDEDPLCSRPGIDLDRVIRRVDAINNETKGEIISGKQEFGVLVLEVSGRAVEVGRAGKTVLENRPGEAGAGVVGGQVQVGERGISGGGGDEGGGEGEGWGGGGFFGGGCGEGEGRSREEGEEGGGEGDVHFCGLVGRVG